MSFFKKKCKDLDELESLETQWSVEMVKANDSPLIVRLNQTAKEWVGHPQLNLKLGFAVPMKSPVPGGLPNPEENKQVEAVADLIIEKVKSQSKGIHVLSLTDGVMKELVFYICEGCDIEALHKEIRQLVTSHEVQCMAELEPKWNTYKMFAG